MTETPANTPNPIGNTSNFFPGGSKGVDAAPAASALAAGDWVGSNELEDGDKDNDNDEDGSTLSGCGVAIGFGTEVSPMTTTGPPEGDRSVLLVLVLLGGGDAELLTLGKGTEVRVTEITGGGTDPELEGGKPVTVEPGGTVSVGTPVLDGRLELESPPVIFGGTPPVSGGTFVLLGGITLDVDEGVPLVPGGGRALVLPSSGVTTQVLSSLTLSTPFTTIGVRVIVHV